MLLLPHPHGPPRPHLHQVELLCLVPGDPPQRHEPRPQLGQHHHRHHQVGRPLHRQQDQVLVQKQETLERELEENGQQPEAGQFGDLELYEVA